MSEFQDQDYANLTFNVYAASKDVDYRQVFNELRIYQEFSASMELDRQKIIRYVVFAYDKNSPFRIKYKEPMTRKVRAMVEAGYPMDKDTNRFPPNIEDVLENRNHKVCDMVIAYLKLHCDILYSHLIMLETLYYAKQKAVYLNNLSAKDNIKELEAIKSAYEQAQKEFLAEEHNSRSLVKSLYANLNRDKIALAPEDVAIAMKEDKMLNELLG